MNYKINIEKIINIHAKLYKYNNFFEKTYLSNEILLKELELFDDLILDQTNILLDILGIPKGEKNKKCGEADARDICTNLISLASKEPKWMKAAIELIVNWESFTDLIPKVQTRTWFYYEDLLTEKAELLNAPKEDTTNISE